MTKTKEELQQLKQEYESFVSKLGDLNEDEIEQIVGGFVTPSHEKEYEPHVYTPDVNDKDFKPNF